MAESYIGIAPNPDVLPTEQRGVFTCLGGETTFNAFYTVNYLDVYLNGVKQVIGTEVVATNGTSFTFALPLATGDVVEYVYKVASSPFDYYSKAQLANGAAAALIGNNAGGALTSTNVQASLLELDADLTSAINTLQGSINTANSSAVHIAGTETITGSKTFSNVIIIPNGTASNHAVSYGQVFGQVNDIGIAGSAGFGVGICPTLPAGFTPLDSYNQPYSDNYGNYQYQDGSIMVWIPAFYYKEGSGSNGLAVNVIDIKKYSYFADVATANTAGYALHRAFYDGGAIQSGVFVDKYKCSNNNGIASSIKNGIPVSSNAANNPYSVCTANGQTPAQFYYGAINAAKSRGNNFFVKSIFINNAIEKLSRAHGQASSSTTYCAWYHLTYNFPKGCNNNALGDANDTSLLFVTTGYSTANRTGSANMFAKTTHNGQNCGIADVNGTIWEVSLGFVTDVTPTNYYIANTSTAMKNFTSGNTLSTDAWGAAGLAANYTSLGSTYQALWATSANRLVYFGNSTNQVFSSAVTGNDWAASCAGIPLTLGVSAGGTNQFGSDGLWDYKVAECCPLVSGSWGNAATAGVCSLGLAHVRSSSDDYVGLRSALYL